MRKNTFFASCVIYMIRYCIYLRQMDFHLVAVVGKLVQK